MDQAAEKSTGTPFKILSIDGGGIKGLYASTILAQLEEKFQCRISDHFDLLAGTSTGGLIALALSLRIPAAQISEFYRKEGPKIFPRQYKFVALMKQTLLRGKFSDKHLRSALERIFDNKLIGESNNLLCIPSYSVTHADNVVFRFDHKEGDLNRDNKRSYVDVALATSAAPTYFPLAEMSAFNNEQYIDGGVWANNPTLVGLCEALRFFVPSNSFQSIEILSISNINLYEGKPKLPRFRSFRHWKSDLFQTSITGQSSFTNFFMTHISSSFQVPIIYERIPSEKVSSSQEHLVQLDTADEDCLNMIARLGTRQGDLTLRNSAVKQFFTTKKTYQTN